ncbi:GNAT family N-acetyltransferase [Thiolapillus sp.]
MTDGSPYPEPWLHSRRLRLREFVWNDSYNLVQMHREPRVRELLVDDEPLDRIETALAFIRFVQNVYEKHPGLGIWVAEQMRAALSDKDLQRPDVREALSDEALRRAAVLRPRFSGWFNLMPMSNQPREVELGSRLKPEVWGSGIAMEGGEMLLNHAFETLERERVYAVSHVDHRSARFVVAALGFSELGIRDYCGMPALHYCLEKEHWFSWRSLSRRERMRHAFTRYKSADSTRLTKRLHARGGKL